MVKMRLPPVITMCLPDDLEARPFERPYGAKVLDPGIFGMSYVGISTSRRF
jgi:hypothetical protein